MSPDPLPEPREVPGDCRSEITPDWAVGFFAAVFTLFGAVLCLPGLRSAATAGLEITPGMRTFFLIFGIPALTAGLVLAVISASRLRDRLRRRLLKSSDGGKPWLWDHAWDSSGTSDDILPKLLVTGLNAAFGAVVGGFFTYAVLKVDMPNNPIALIAVFYDLWALWYAANAARQILQYAMIGPTRIRFDAFPFRLGETARFHIDNWPRRGHVRETACVLHCVQERIKESWLLGRRQAWVVRDELYRIPLDMEKAERSGSSLQLSLALPSVPLPTSLSSRPPRYWELEIRSEDGLEFLAAYLMPVY